jgi:signal transduction histidine kinase
MEDRVLVGRINMLIRQQPIVFIGLLINSLLFALVLSTAWSAYWLIVWTAAVWIMVGLRYAIWLQVRNGVSDPHEALRVARLFTAGSTVSGLFWGLAGVVFFPDDPIALQGFIVFVLGGMSAGAMATLSSYLPAFLSFAGLTILPIAVRLMLEGGLLYTVMGIMLLLYFVLLSGSARNINRTIAQSLGLGFEKSELVENLNHANRQAEVADLAKSNFFSLLSHELRTPLTAVLGFAEMMRARTFGPLGHEKYDDYVDGIYTSGDHLRSLIDELLDLTGGQAKTVQIQEEKFDPGPILEDCLNLLAERADAAGLGLEGRFADPLPQIYADKRRLRQILVNVLTNAIEFTPRGGHIEAAAGCDGNGNFVVTVSDSGEGAAEDAAPAPMKLFDLSESNLGRRSRHSGIGLPLTKLLIDSHDGMLEIASEKGAGTRISFGFPAERVFRAAGDT